MKIKNLTPFLVGPKVTSRRPPAPEMTVIVRAAFTLRPGEPLVAIEKITDQPALSAETYLREDDERAGEATYGGDFADFKLRAEMLLRGTCYAPGGTPVAECPVRFAVGALSKILRVVGPRAWSDGLIRASTDPVPFSKMPLTYANAFGGPGYARNPVGKGVGTSDLPTIERPGEPVRARGDRFEPAGFGPLSSSWPQRAGKVGKEYGAAYRAKRAPFYAEDFDWSYFQSAPADQQFEGYLRGDEEVSFQNLHKAAPVFSTRLPGLRVRAFANDAEGAFREVAMSLDTVFADPDEEVLLLTWRGITSAKQDDLKDIRTVLVASEPLGDKPLAKEHYQAIVDGFEKDPLGREAAIEQHVPKHLQDAAKRVLKGEPAFPDPPAGTPPIDALTQKIAQASGADAAKTADIKRGLERAVAAAGPGFDLGAATSGKSAPRPAGAPPPSLAAAGNTARERVVALKAMAAEKGITLPNLDAADSISTAGQRAAPAKPKPGQREPGPGMHCEGGDYTNRDFSGRDLRGVNFEGAVLAGANLRMARLTGANLQRASLVDADLEEANLETADLTEANLTGCNARGANFKGATLSKSFFSKTNLAGANLDETKAQTLFLTGVDLTKATALRATWFKVVVRGAVLTGADFSEAELSRCHFLQCRGDGFTARNALLTGSSFAGSELGQACFASARGERTIWLGASIAGADFSLSVLPWAHFTDATAPRAKFYGANLKEARFYRASLDQANLAKSNLFGANFCKASLTSAKFTDANLYNAKFLGSAGTGTDFVGANLKLARFEP